MVKEIYLFRMSYGLLMMIYSANKCTDDVYDPTSGVYFDFRHRIPSILQVLFEFFPWYTRSSLYWRTHCPLMLLAAAGIAFGQGNISKMCCFLFGVLKGVLLLLDQTKYNNHEYLYSTIAFVLCLCDCHDIIEYSLSHCMSTKNTKLSTVFSCCLLGSLAYLLLNNAVYGIPGLGGLCGVLLMWYSLIFLLGGSQSADSNSNRDGSYIWLQRIYLQLFIGVVYFYAGLAKTDTDWLSGSTARELLARWSMDAGSSSSLAQLVVHHTTWLLSISEERFYVLFAYAGLLLDSTALPGLMAPFTVIRVFYTLLLVVFHVSNHFLFILETFPFVMISTSVLYHDCRWIDWTFRSTVSVFEALESRIKGCVDCYTYCLSVGHKCWKVLVKPLLLNAILVVHFLIPLRCALHTPFDLGSISWSTSCQYFQWRMMTRSVRTIASHLRFVHPLTGEQQIVTLDMLAFNLCPRQQQDQQVCPEMSEFLQATPQYEDRLYQTIRDARARALSPEDTTAGQRVPPPSVFADVWLEINGPPIQRFIKPTIDIGGRETLSSSNVSFVTLLSEKPRPLSDWVLPRIEKFRTMEWIQRMQNISVSEKAKQMRRWRKNGLNESVVIEKGKRVEVLYVADLPSSGESYFYFYRSARVQLLQGRAFLSSHGPVDSSNSSEYLEQGIVKWFAVGDAAGQVCAVTDCPGASPDAALWKIVLPEGVEHFDIKPFDDGRIKSVK